MDKLQPIIRQRFWVLFGLALPLALAGYFMTSGKMTAATEAEEESLTSTIDGVPKGDTEPNETYSAGLKVINGELKEDNKTEVQKLWEGQKDRMDWPTVMVTNNYIPNEYRAEIESAGRRYYTQIYPEVIKRIWEGAQPVVDDPPPYGLEVTWEPKLYLLPETIPLHEFPANFTPSNKQIWDAQEDVWLLELIFDGIVSANKGASWIGDAPVRSIDDLYLTGGSGTPVLMDAGGGGAGEGAAGGFGDGMRMEDDDMGLGMGGMAAAMGAGRGGGMGGTAGGKGVGFNVAEEFGPQVPDPEAQKAAEEAAGSMGGDFGGFGAGDPAMGMGGMAGEMAGGPMAGMMGGMGGMGGGAMADAYRYIGEPTQVETQPYRERGFYMSAIVMLPELPSIFAEMSSSEWPIRILRFQIGPNPYAPDNSANALGGGLAGSGRRGGVGMGVADVDDAFGGGFGSSRMGGFGGRGISSAGRRPSMGARGLGRMLDEDAGGGMFGGFGGSRGGMGNTAVMLPRSMQGPSYTDPNWFAHPDLVQVDFCGIITMYNPQTDDTIKPTDDGSSEEATPEALAEREEEALKAAEEAEAEAEAAAADQAANPLVGDVPADGQPGSEPGSPAEPQPPADANAPADETSDTPPFGDEASGTDATDADTTDTDATEQQ